MTAVSELGNRLYFDTNIFIYGIEGYSRYAEVVRALFRYADEIGVVVIANRILLAELLPKPLAARNDAVLARYKSLLTEGESVELVDIDHSVAMTAVDMCARHNLRPLDGLHLATALVHDCTAFVTNDRTLARVDDLPVFLLADLAPA